jgi:hypothetical protein
MMLRHGTIEADEYHRLLKKLSTFREIEKPEVKITRVKFEAWGDAEVAHGFALNHPRLGKTDVRTSLVVFKAEDGSFFETLNTRYVIVDAETPATNTPKSKSV